jgi:hypothetical protein
MSPVFSHLDETPEFVAYPFVSRRKVPQTVGDDPEDETNT